MTTEDIAIIQAGIKVHERPVRLAPVYLVKIEDPTMTNKSVHFLATKVDEGPHSVKIVGFEIKKDINKIGENYQEVLNVTDKSLYMELILSWQRVIKIQNLIFRQK